MAFTVRYVYELNLNTVVLYKIHVARYGSRADLPIVDFKFFAKTQLLELDGVLL